MLFSKKPLFNLIGYQWVLIDFVDLLQSVLILFSAIFIVRFMKKQMEDERNIYKSFTDDAKTMNSLKM